MGNFFILKWIRDISIAKKLYFVLGTMAFLIALELFALVFTMNTLSATRTLVGAEGLWSKAQKDAAYYLQKYGIGKNEEDYLEYLHYLNVPAGDTKARLELLKPNPDLDIVRQGFSQGRVHKDDIDGIIKLLRRFSGIFYIHSAITYWTQGDSLMTVLKDSGLKLHAQILSLTEPQHEIEKTLRNVETANEKLTILEDKFSYTLGEGSRWLEKLILKVLFGIALTVELTGLFLIISVSMGISRSIAEVIRVSVKVANADFSDRARKYSEDEIGTLASSFNNMINNLEIKVKEKNETERQLQQQKDLYETLLNAQSEMGEGVFLSVGEKTVYVNEAFCKMHGYGKDEFIGMSSLFDIVPKEEKLKLREKMRTYVKDERYSGSKGETSLIRKDGQMIHVEYSFNRVRVNNILHTVSIVRDITDRKRSENLLQSAKDAFEKQAKELSRSNADLEQFAYISSHDLQEPLRTIVSYLQLLEVRFKNKVDSEAEEYINFAVDGAKRMHILISDLLTYSRIGTNKKTFDRVDCNKAIHLVLINLDRIMQDCGTSVILETAMPVIMADQLQITQLFQNLIENAIKYRVDGKAPLIKIAANRKDGKWLFSVSDNGIGIAREYFDRIFVIFQRLHTREKYSGTGIGLALCKKIVERHGGNIWVESEERSGSVFYFTIPDRIHTNEAA